MASPAQPVPNAPAVEVGSTLRDLSRAQWNAFFAAFFGWVLDGFDFSILSFLLLDISRSFTVDNALAGALGTVTLLCRLVGGLGAGTAADRYGRKPPLVLSILWFSLFSLLSGFSTSYAMLFALRALFGIGMGGVWTAGMPLALEHWPDRLRGIASGLLQGGFPWGYMLAAVAFELIYPVVNTGDGSAWRVFFWLGACPALLGLWIALRVKESPLWVARREKTVSVPEGLSILRIFQRELLGTTVQTCLFMSVLMMSYYSIIFWYPTFVRESRLPTLPYLAALNIGSIAGSAGWGRISETRVGRRGASVLAILLGVLMAPLYVEAHSSAVLIIGSVLMGICGAGVWGIVPSYLTERFPTAARGVGPGFAYHVGAAIGSVTPALIGMLQDRGMPLKDAMAICIAISGVLVAVVVCLGPETRGRRFTPAA